MTTSLTKFQAKLLGFTFKQETQGIAEYRFDKNDLKVVIKEDHSKPVVTFMQMFRVGSRNETPADDGLTRSHLTAALMNSTSLAGTTGATHFLEHLMFKGTEEHNPDNGTGVFQTFGPLGNLLNATTSFDRTTYFECVSAQHLETCMEIESDRMRNLRLDPAEVESERGVVLEEMSMGLKSPDRIMLARMYETAFDVHPYQWMTIGRRKDVETVTLAQLRAYYDTFYWPDNCTLIMRGDLTILQALRLIAKHYGEIPKAPHTIPIVWAVEPLHKGARRYEVRKAGALPRVLLGFHVSDAGHDDTYALAMISQLLGNNELLSSRLYSGLIESGLAASASCTSMEQRNPGLFTIKATVSPDSTVEQVEAALLAELAKLATEPVPEEELQLARDSNRTSTMESLQDPMDWAQFICSGEATVCDWRWKVEFDDEFDRVTAQDVQRVAAKYFTPLNRTIGHFVPTENEADKA